jgi:hypothetical protein
MRNCSRLVGFHFYLPTFLKAANNKMTFLSMVATLNEILKPQWFFRSTFRKPPSCVEPISDEFSRSSPHTVPEERIQSFPFRGVPQKTLTCKKPPIIFFWTCKRNNESFPEPCHHLFLLFHTPPLLALTPQSTPPWSRQDGLEIARKLLHARVSL